MTEAEEAAAHWGGRLVRKVAERENAVHEMTLPDDRRAALRLHRPGYQSAAAIRSELWWCAALADAGVAVARPLAGLDGALLVRLTGGRHASAVEWVEGEPIGRAGTALPGDAAEHARTHRDLGRLLAKLHTATDAMTLPQDFTRPRWDLPGLVGAAPFWGRFWEHPALRAPERDLLGRARRWLRDLLAEAGDFGLVHADGLRENVMAGPAGLTLIDFDDCGWGFRGYELGSVLSQNLSEPHLHAIAEALADGYGETRGVDRDTLPGFTLMRCCASVGWTMPRLRPDDPVNASYIARAVRLAESVLAGRGFG